MSVGKSAIGRAERSVWDLRRRSGAIAYLHRVLTAAFFLLCACSPITEDTPGSVYKVTESSVTLSGPFARNSMDAFFAPYENAQPTEAMKAQAREICPNATFTSASPNPADFDSLLFLFRC